MPETDLVPHGALGALDIVKPRLRDMSVTPDMPAVPRDCRVWVA
jgi:hypothetical protein